jgi:hypothetical protein
MKKSVKYSQVNNSNNTADAPSIAASLADVGIKTAEAIVAGK